MYRVRQFAERNGPTTSVRWSEQRLSGQPKWVPALFLLHNLTSSYIIITMKNKLPTIYKRTEGGAIEQWTIIVEDNTFYTESGQVNGRITTSKPTICEVKNTGQANERTAEEQALSEAKAKWKKQTEKGYTTDIKKVDEAQKSYYRPMLAHKYDDHKDKVKFPCYCQRKSDGIRCVLTKDGAFSRNGKEFVTIPHIQEALRSIFQDNPDTILDGELYNHELHDNFNKIASLVKKTKPSIEDLFESAEKVQYHIYDAPRIDGLDESIGFAARNLRLNKVLHRFTVSHTCIKIVATFALNSPDDVLPMHDKFIEEGYEGLMIRMDKPYQNKRSKYLLKFKVFDTEEFIIRGISAGRGNKANMAAFVSFVTKAADPFTAGIIGDDEYCKDLLNRRELFVGKLATVKYFRLTPDGIPRFPKVVEVDRQDV